MKNYNILYSALFTVLTFSLEIGALNCQTRLRNSKIEPQSIFKFGCIAGPLLSQLDGDGHTGYNKLGIYAGLKGEALLSNSFFIEVDLTFSSLGSKIPQELPNSRIVENKRIVRMNFVEVPLLINYKLPHKTYPLNLEIGMGLKQLIHYSVEEDAFSARLKSFASLESEINKRNFSGIVGIERFYKDFTIGVRATFAINYQYYNKAYFDNLQQRKSVDNLVPLLRSYYISLVGSYTIFGKKIY